MAYFLLQGAYTSASWKNLVNNPTDRIEVVRPVIEKLGGKVAGVVFVIELEFLRGRERLSGYDVVSLIRY